MYKLYLDDTRNPKTEGWIIVRSYQDFISHISNNGAPYLISFDHDLGLNEHGEEYNGYDCAKWLCDYCYDSGLPLPNWNIHSANSVGFDNINFVLNNYKKKFG